MKKLKGFTLIELMIVLSIIGIISMVVVPSYNANARKAKRSDAQQLILDVANRQQQFLLDARQYSTSFTALNITKDNWTCTNSNCANNFYTITIAANNLATPPTFTVTATATGSQGVDGDLTMDNTGARTHNGNTGWY